MDTCSVSGFVVGLVGHGILDAILLPMVAVVSASLGHRFGHHCTHGRLHRVLNMLPKRFRKVD